MCRCMEGDEELKQMYAVSLTNGANDPMTVGRYEHVYVLANGWDEAAAKALKLHPTLRVNNIAHAGGYVE